MSLAVDVWSRSRRWVRKRDPDLSVRKRIGEARSRRRHPHRPRFIRQQHTRGAFAGFISAPMPWRHSPWTESRRTHRDASDGAGAGGGPLAGIDERRHRLESRSLPFPQSRSLFDGGARTVGVHGLTSASIARAREVCGTPARMNGHHEFRTGGGMAKYWQQRSRSIRLTGSSHTTAPTRHGGCLVRAEF